MKKLNLLLGLLIVLITLACSSDDNNSVNNPPNESIKLLKQISWNDGYSEKYFYDSQSRLILTIHNDFAFADNSFNDSTFVEYVNSNISKILKREQSGSNIVNTELIFNNYNSNSASGTFKIFTDSGNNYSDLTFEYSFMNNLLKSYTRLNLDGTKNYEQIFNHNEDGNLTEWNEIWYSTNNQINNANYNSITEWDSGNKVTEKLFAWDSEYLPGFVLSANNCLNLIDSNTTYDYTFEYDNEGYVKKYTIDNGDFFTLEYYE